MNRRILLTVSALVCSLIGLLPLAGARQTQPKTNGLHADLVGPRGSGGAVDLFLSGRGRTLKAQVWRLPAAEVRIVLGNKSFPLSVNPSTGSGSLVIDGSLGQRFPGLTEGSVVGITIRGQVVMKGELLSR